MKQKKKWSALAKFEVALNALKNDATISDICQKHQVAPSQVHAWKKQLQEEGVQLFVSKNNKANKQIQADLEKTQQQLYEKIGKLTVERDFLKKSLETFHGH